VVAPSLIPVRAGDRVKTDRRDARKLVSLYRAGLLGFVAPPTPETEGLRDLLRCRDDIRRARTAARNGSACSCCATGTWFREGKKSWTARHRAWVRRQRLADRLAHEALVQMLICLDGLDRQLAALDANAQNHPQRVRCDGWLDDEIAGSGTLATLRRVNVYLQHAGRFPFDRQGAALTRA
jgi:transposase